MSVERIYSCERPGCPVTTTGDSRVPEGWIETEEREGIARTIHHFHSWACVARFALEEGRRR